MDDIATAPVRLRTPRDIVDAVPYLIGFQPANSLVVVSLRGERRRVGMTARVDLPPPEHAATCARYLADCLRRNQAEQALVVLYPPKNGLRHSSVRPVHATLTQHFHRVGIELVETLCVGDGRWWSLQCADERCCPAAGTSIEPTHPSALAAEMAVRGRVVLGSRAEMARAIEPVAGAEATAMATELARAVELLETRRTAGADAETAAETVRLARAAVSARLAGRCAPPPSPPDVARLIAGLHDVRARDEVLTWFDGEWGAATNRLLVELVRHAVPPHQGTVLTLLGWNSYLQGDGAIAGIAAERALQADPDCGLADILDRSLAAGIDPQTYRPDLRVAGRNWRRPRSAERGRR